MKLTHFDNYDLNEAANNVARQIIASDVELERRIKFETNDIMQVKEKLSEYLLHILSSVGWNEHRREKEVSWPYQDVYEAGCSFAGQKC